MRKSVVYLLAAVLVLLPALAALAAGGSEADKAELARLNGEVEGLKSRLAAGVSRGDFGGACADCHGPTPKYPLLGARLGYDTSGHKNNDNSYYANGQGCQKCHTNEGFIEFAATGKVDPKSFVASPSQPNCVTCHTQHETWDFGLRTVKPVKLVDGAEFDLGKGNLCAACHQASGAASAVVKASPAASVFPFWGAHHGPQSDVVNGTNAWEYRGRQYASSPHKQLIKDGCVECHMALPEGRYGLSPEVGGHSFNVVGEVHEAEKVNTAGCLACHKEVKQLPGTDFFDLKAKADFDRDGRVEAVQAEVQGVLELFVNPKGGGALQTLNPPMFKPDAQASFAGLTTGWAGSRTGQWSELQMAALYNYKLFVEDRSRGVHNLTYAIQVLYDALKSLDPRFDDSLRP